jgi:chemotaxis protein CheD
MNKYYLYPGSVFISKTPHIVDTVLGSCIAVIIWNPVLQFGSISHYMLPEWNGTGQPVNKYGNVAISYLIKQMLVLGSNRADLRAKVFGGSINKINGVFNIGSRNTELAFNILKKEKIRVISQSVGGTLNRKAIFYSNSGDVLIKFIQPIKAASIAPTALKQ